MTQQAMCGSVRYRDLETAFPACRFLCKTCTVEITNNPLPRRYELTVEEFRELFDCPSYYLVDRLIQDRECLDGY
jgi:hypothetical protein